jgi:hypothetical protein
MIYHHRAAAREALDELDALAACGGHIHQLLCPPALGITKLRWLWCHKPKAKVGRQ